ncbi:MAG: hypothetical protein K2Q97_15620 [Burkholderiaceae bacterium]|nr:hypothetical protein [Burkholderiaceae bacterium]
MDKWSVLFSCAAVAGLAACSKSDDLTSASPPTAALLAPAAQEVVDAADFFKNTPNYEGRKVYLYLERVSASDTNSPESDIVDSMDSRAISRYGVLTFSESALKKWTAIGLDSERVYTVTFGVRATDVTGGKKAIYDVVAEDFKVNYDGGARFRHLAAPKPLGANKLPLGELKLPVPMTIKDLRQLELFSAQYEGKQVRVSRTLLKDRVTPHDDQYLLVDSEGSLKFLVKKELVMSSFSTWPSVATIEITGKVVTDGAQTSVLGDEIALFH